MVGVSTTLAVPVASWCTHVSELGIPHTSKTKGDPRRTERQARLQLVRVSRETTPRRGWNRCVWAYGGEMDSQSGQKYQLAL